MESDGVSHRENGGWAEALPEKIPLPTYAPLFLALGIIFLLFGIVTRYIFSAVGVVLMVWSLAKWIGELFDEQ